MNSSFTYLKTGNTGLDFGGFVEFHMPKRADWAVVPTKEH